MYKIFVIEDDNVISGEIQSHLQKWGYEEIGRAHV